MRDAFTALTAFGAGMLAMYYFDAQNGRRRRALLRDKVYAGTRSTWHRGQKEARHVANRARGVAATGHLDRMSRRPPEDDRQLHERIRAHMGHVLSHPGAIHVHVQQGEVTLTGHVLRREVAPLLDCVRGIPGVRRLDNQLLEHENPNGIPDLQGAGRRPAQQGSSPAGTAWH